MDKWDFLKYGIELIVVLIPVGSLFAKFVGWRQSIEGQMSQVWKELGRLDNLSKSNENLIHNIETRLSSIDTKLDLILEGRLK